MALGRDPAVLSIEWYKAQMQRLRKESGISELLICSDNIDYCKDSFSEELHTFFGEGNVVEDMGRMLECSAGVLSASSLSWWVAYMIYRQNDCGEFIAPKYWAGWRTGEWFPRSIASSFLTYVEAF